MQTYKDTLDHYKDNNDSLIRFQKGATAVLVAGVLAGVFREPIAKAAKAGWNKVKGIWDEKVFRKPVVKSTDEVVDGEYKEMES